MVPNNAALDPNDETLFSPELIHLNLSSCLFTSFLICIISHKNYPWKHHCLLVPSSTYFMSYGVQDIDHVGCKNVKKQKPPRSIQWVYFLSVILVFAFVSLQYYVHA